ncbi:hypothetical protein SAMN05192574_101828 [Mucilaginibacter gossypiicola]|uniref:Uncharacterized protein n=1 Tax=Mucilaginibacter gossypiicola TaxID=551995 RepID=A0A1H8B8U1_9SPHI|nr:hypothetical protein [Mucilaginibacter gossypiicola]SEM79223.1 hypothetical protein SAMN05192574_101828 [Mucilaginibacter gossypiicola]
MTTINAYQLGYYLTEFGAAFFAPNGFANKLLDWPTLADDFCTSMSGMAGEFTDAFHPVSALLSVILSCAGIYFSAVMLSNAKRRLTWLGFILIGLAALLAVYDPNRNEFYPKLLRGSASWLAELPYLADLRYILPSFALLIYIQRSSTAR